MNWEIVYASFSLKVGLVFRIVSSDKEAQSSERPAPQRSIVWGLSPFWDQETPASFHPTYPYPPLHKILW